MAKAKASNPPPFSALINAYTAKLKQYLQAIQFVSTSDKLVLDRSVESEVKRLVSTIRALTSLKKAGWKLTPEPENSDYEHRVWLPGGKAAVEPRHIEWGIVGDLAELAEHIYYIYQKAGKPIAYRLKLPSCHIYVKPRFLPIPQYNIKMLQVQLKDGNVAWLTPETLRKIQQLLSQA